MEKAAFYARLFLSFSLVCLSASIAYFSYAVLHTVQEIPDIINEMDEAAQFMGPVVQHAETITTLIPGIVEEVSLIREQIPAILAEVEQIRQAIPPVIEELANVRGELPSLVAESQGYRQLIPTVLTEVKQVRGEIPSIVAESQGYRQLIPTVLAEAGAIRAIIPPTMDRAEKLITEASNAGQQASEGAVTGFFTGIVKAPFKMISGASDSVFGQSVNLSDKQAADVKALSLDMLNEHKVGSEEPWGNKKSGFGGDLTVLKDFQREGRLCRLMGITILEDGKLLENRKVVLCLDKDREWVVVSRQK